MTNQELQGVPHSAYELAESMMLKGKTDPVVRDALVAEGLASETAMALIQTLQSEVARNRRLLGQKNLAFGFASILLGGVTGLILLFVLGGWIGSTVIGTTFLYGLVRVILGFNQMGS